jgi:hypothetical protein
MRSNIKRPALPQNGNRTEMLPRAHCAYQLAVTKYQQM